MGHLMRIKLRGNLNDLIRLQLCLSPRLGNTSQQKHYQPSPLIAETSPGLSLKITNTLLSKQEPRTLLTLSNQISQKSPADLIQYQLAIEG